MNYTAAADFNLRAERQLWMPEQLPDRFRRILAARNQCIHVPALLDEARAAVRGGFVTSSQVALLCQEVALYQRLHGLVPDGCLGPLTLREMKACGFAPDPAVPLRGKGLWVWNESHLPDGHAELAARAGVRHVLIKVADHGSVHPSSLPEHQARKRLRELFAAYRAVGVMPVPWVYAGAYAQDSRDQPTRLLREVELHGELAVELGACAFVVNAEKGFKDRYTKNGQVVRLPHHRAHAARYMAELRALNVPIGLSSYHFVDGHRNFAWEEMVRGADFLMPQTYWSLKHRTKDDPHRAVHDATAEWDEVAAAVGRGRPMLPSGALYQTKGPTGWPPEWHAPEDITAMIRMTNELQVPGCTFWWYVAPRDTAGGSSRVTKAQWKAFAATEWIEA